MSKATRYIVLTMVLGGLGCILLCGGFVAFFIFAKVDEEVTSQDKELLVNLQDVAPYTYSTLNFNPDLVKLSKVYHLANFQELTLEYAYGSQSMVVRVYQDSDAYSVQDDYETEWSMALFGQGDELSLKERSGYTCCHASRFGDIMYGEERLGTLFVAKQGRISYSVFITGFYIEDPRDMEHIFERPLQAIKKGYGL